MSRDLEDMDVRSMFILLGKITEGDYSSKVGDPKRLVAAEIIQKLYEYTPWDVLEVYPVEGPWICSRLFPDPGGWWQAAAMGMSRADIIGKGKGDFMTRARTRARATSWARATLCAGGARTSRGRSRLERFRRGQ